MYVRIIVLFAFSTIVLNRIRVYEYCFNVHNFDNVCISFNISLIHILNASIDHIQYQVFVHLIL